MTLRNNYRFAPCLSLATIVSVCRCFSVDESFTHRRIIIICNYRKEAISCICFKLESMRIVMGEALLRASTEWDLDGRRPVIEGHRWPRRFETRN